MYDLDGGESFGDFGYVEDSLEGWQCSDKGSINSGASKTEVSDTNSEADIPAKVDHDYLEGMAELFANKVDSSSYSILKVRSLDIVQASKAVNSGGNL